MSIFPQDERTALMSTWLQGLSKHWAIVLDSLSVASADASFRRYFRVQSQHPDFESMIVMDAPPAHENCQPFVEIASLFATSGVKVPQILEKDLVQGFLLLSDLGNETYLAALNALVPNAEALPSVDVLKEAEVSSPQILSPRADELYRSALCALVQLQKASVPEVLPVYSRERLLNEMMLFVEWYLGVHYQYRLSDEQTLALTGVFNVILDNNTAQTQVWVHRDFHSRNLMVLAGLTEPGILDFQDAVWGPITYDAVSLLRDAYVEWDEAQQMDWLIRYWELARKAGLGVPTNFDEFYRDFEFMGLQRHLKVLGIFARLYHRDGKAGYLNDLPLVLKYTRQVAGRYREFAPLLRLLDDVAVHAGERAAAVEVGYTF